MNKKVVILGILAVCLSISIGIGFSYAVWTQTEKQNDMNVFESGCFKIEITEEKDIIDLSNQYPILDEGGKKLTPYTFTVKNNCSLYASYAVNLEKLAGSDLDNQYIKVMLNNKRPQLYNYYNITTKEDDSSVDSRTLTTDGLGDGETRTYTLRIWIDESGTNETVGNKRFSSKIVIKSVATYQSGAEYIASLLESNKETMINDDPDENVRYIGATPNNYVTFNDEPWRIIGVFDMFECEDDATVETYTTKCSTKKLLKLIRNESIGEYSWDSSDVSVNGGNGINEWSTSAIQVALNGAYYNSENGTCYGGYNLLPKKCDFTVENHNSTKGLDEITRTQVAKVIWNTGTISGIWDGNQSKYTVQIFYEAERSNNSGEWACNSGTTYCNDNLPRTTKWIGKVGLMYPSDYGLATGSGNSKDRNSCLQKAIFTWADSSFADCKANDWLFNSSEQWTMTPATYSSQATVVFRVRNNGIIHDHSANFAYGIRPVVYLKSDIKIIHDDAHIGSVEHPYELTF